MSCLVSAMSPRVTTSTIPTMFFASIQEKLISNHMKNGYVIMGDMIARFSKAVRDLALMY